MRLILRTIVILSASALLGCAMDKTTKPAAAVKSHQQSPVGPNAADQPYIPTHAAAKRAVETAKSLESESVEFAGDTPARPDHPPATAVVGLYGEQVSESANAGASFDGGANLSQVTHSTEGGDYDPGLDSDGQFLYFSSTQHRPTADIYRKSVSGRTVTQLTDDPADDLMPTISPDGSKLAFTSNRSGNWDIHVMDADGGSAVQITSDTEQELRPSWSPDGKRLVYSKFGQQSGRWELWVVNWRKPGVRKFVGYGQFPQWCPDPTHSKILFQRSRQRGERLYSVWTIDFVNGEGINQTEIISAANAAIINPTWSPDGARIAFATVLADEITADRPTQSDIWIAGIEGSDRMNLTSGQFANFQPVWGPNGRIFFVSDRSGNDNIWAISTERAMELSQPADTSQMAEAKENAPMDDQP